MATLTSSPPFIDIAESSKLFPLFAYAWEHRYIPRTEYADPERVVTIAELAAFALATSGREPDHSLESLYRDLPPTHPYHAELLTAFEEFLLFPIDDGVIEGVPQECALPDRPATMEEAVHALLVAHGDLLPQTENDPGAEYEARLMGIITDCIRPFRGRDPIQRDKLLELLWNLHHVHHPERFI